MSTELEQFVEWLAVESAKADEGWKQATEEMHAGVGHSKFLVAMNKFELHRDRHERIWQAKRLVNEWRASR